MELGELSRLFAVDRATIRRRLNAQGRSLYVYPLDQRLRMVREADIRAVFQIIPAPQRACKGGPSEG
jgi:hypothetical protein